MKTVLFYPEQNIKNMGQGHISRCLNLTQYFRHVFDQIYILLPQKINLYIPSYVIPIYVSNKILIHNIQTITTKIHSIDCLVIDDLKTDYHDEIKIRQYVKKLMIIEWQSGRTHQCDFLLDYETTNARSYKGKLLNVNTYLFLGKNFTLFSNRITKGIKKINRPLSHILIFFTLGDDYGLTKMALKAVQEFSFNITVITNNKSQFNQYKNNPRITIYSFIKNFPKFLKSIDLIIGSYGVNTLETSFIGIPRIGVAFTENQQHLAKILKNVVYPIQYKNINETKFTQAINFLTQNNYEFLKKYQSININYWKNYQNKLPTVAQICYQSVKS